MTKFLITWSDNFVTSNQPGGAAAAAAAAAALLMETQVLEMEISDIDRGG